MRSWRYGTVYMYMKKHAHCDDKTVHARYSPSVFTLISSPFSSVFPSTRFLSQCFTQIQARSSTVVEDSCVMTFAAHACMQYA